MELWAKDEIPTKSIFLVTHNIEEAVLLANPIVVLEKHPGEDPRRFPRFTTPAARSGSPLSSSSTWITSTK